MITFKQFLKESLVVSNKATSQGTLLQNLKNEYKQHKAPGTIKSFDELYRGVFERFGLLTSKGAHAAASLVDPSKYDSSVFPGGFKDIPVKEWLTEEFVEVLKEVGAESEESLIEFGGCENKLKQLIQRNIGKVKQYLDGWIKSNDCKITKIDPYVRVVSGTYLNVGVFVHYENRIIDIYGVRLTGTKKITQTGYILKFDLRTIS